MLRFVPPEPTEQTETHRALKSAEHDLVRVKFQAAPILRTGRQTMTAAFFGDSQGSRRVLLRCCFALGVVRASQQASGGGHPTATNGVRATLSALMTHRSERVCADADLCKEACAG